MKRQQTENSSFDLFLDTICNTFGGIVFLAILLAIMIQTRAVVRTPDGMDQQPPTPDEVRTLIVQLDAISAQHSDLGEALKNTPASARSAGDSEFQQLAAQLDQLTDELTEAAAQQASQTRQLAELLAENARLQDENSQVPAELQAAQHQVAQSTAALRTTVADQQQTLQLPRVRASSASSVLLLLDSAQVYLALQPSLFGGDYNHQHVNIKQVASGGTEIAPVVGAGWHVGTSEGREGIRGVIRTAAAGGHIITIAVWPDSYDDFAEVKSQMVGSQVGYQLWPQKEGELLTVYRGGGGSRVQ